MSTVGFTGEHEFEAVPGLPEPLPVGENVLWQGSPSWTALARRAFHLRKLTIYFLIILAARFVVAISDGMALDAALVTTLKLAPLALIALGLVTLMAWLSARTTLYTITDRRVVMRVCIVLTITYNLPLRAIHAAGLKAYSDQTGDISLRLAPGERIAYLNLWPHARAWRLAQPEPTLRTIANAQAVAAMLSTALASTTSSTTQASRDDTVAAPPINADTAAPRASGDRSHYPMAA